MKQEQHFVEARRRIEQNTATAADFILVNSFIEQFGKDGKGKSDPKRKSRRLGRKLRHTRNAKLKK